MLTSYETYRKDHKDLNVIKWRAALFDEGTEVEAVPSEILTWRQPIGLNHLLPKHLRQQKGWLARGDTG
jgi:hypothetical protein